MMCPEIVNEVDDQGNFPIHTLCMNTVTKKDELHMMLLFILQANPKTYLQKQGEGLTPLQLIQWRANEANPYDT